MESRSTAPPIRRYRFSCWNNKKNSDGPVQRLTATPAEKSRAGCDERYEHPQTRVCDGAVNPWTPPVWPAIPRASVQSTATIATLSPKLIREGRLIQARLLITRIRIARSARCRNIRKQWQSWEPNSVLIALRAQRFSSLSLSYLRGKRFRDRRI